MPILLTLLLVLLSAGGTADKDDLFSLEDNQQGKEIVDLLGVSPETKTTDKFEFRKIIKGDFLPNDGIELFLVEVAPGFSKESPSRFRMGFATISEGKLLIQSDNYVLEGVPLEVKSAILDEFGKEKVVLHWRGTDGAEYIHVINPYGGMAEDIFPGRIVPKGRHEEVALADIDGNGICEICILSTRTSQSPSSEIDKVLVYYNRGAKLESESYALNPVPVSEIVVQDIDADGKDEILTLRTIDLKKFKYAIWAIDRNDDGSYTEKPVFEGVWLKLIPSCPDRDDLLFYSRKNYGGGQYYRFLNVLDLKNPSDDRTAEFRLLPDGTIYGMSWGKFPPNGDDGLVLLSDDGLGSQMSLGVYSLSANDRQFTQSILFESMLFNPDREAIAIDIDSDNFDELIFFDKLGSLSVLDLEKWEISPLRISRLR